MAGIFPAINWGKSEIAGFSVYNGAPRLHLYSSKYPSRCKLPKPFFRMALPEMQNGSPEVQEPSPKIPKLQQNGDHEASQSSGPLFRVKKLSEKAVLPSRGSPLAAGYDLSR